MNRQTTSSLIRAIHRSHLTRLPSPSNSYCYHLRFRGYIKPATASIPKSLSTYNITTQTLQNKNPRNTLQNSSSSSSRSPLRLSTQQIRYCSAHRKMCRGHDLNVSGGSMNSTTDRVVLPTDVKPTNYTVELEPDFEKFTYEGTVKIA